MRTTIWRDWCSPNRNH